MTGYPRKVASVTLGRRLLHLACAITAMALATGAQAQSYGPAQSQGDDPLSENGPQQRAPDPQGNGQQAATSQVATPSANDRYKPDQIDEAGARPSSDRDNPQTESSEAPNGRATREKAAPLVRRPRAPSEFETYVSNIVDKPLRRFGEDLLTPMARDFTTPPTTTVPLDYRLNPGDELIVGLTGSVQASNLRLTIDSEGRVFIPRVGAVNVGGAAYGQVQALIAQHVSRVYRDFKVAVSIGRLHGITVYVTGFAASPGSYTVSSLSTLVNAVLAAGGPSAGGSFRSIQVRRAGQLLSNFDLYDLLLKGDKSADVVLQNGDVIYIAPVGPQIAVIGSVNNEAIFEARPDDTLSAVLAYAGGPNTVADDNRLFVLDPLRADTGGWEQLTNAEGLARPAKRGEIVRVLSGVGIARPLQQQPVLVTISGEVAKPGRYYVPAGTVLSDAIDRAGGLTPDAYTYATVFTRESVKQEQRVSYERALRDVELLLSEQPLTSTHNAGQPQPAQLEAIHSVVEQLEARKPEGRIVLEMDPAAAHLPGDLKLENNDTIYVPPPPTTVGVFGSVPNPSSFRFRPNMTLRDFLERAGGVQKSGDRSQIFVVRANGALLAPHRGLFGRNVLNQRALPGDLIFVPIAGARESIWAKINTLSSVLVQGAIIASSVAVVSR